MMPDRAGRRRAPSTPSLRTLLATAALVALSLLAACGGELPLAAPATVAPFPGNADPPLLVDAAWLRATQAAGALPLLILDLSPLRTYRRGHVPGAVHAWWQDTMELNAAVYGTVLKPDDYTDQTDRIDALRDMGVSDEVFVVAYDNDRGRWAARLVWFLRFVGHDRAAVLEGGLAGWRGAGGETEASERDPPDASPPTVAPREGYYIETDELIARRADPRTLVLDVRTPAEAQDDVNGLFPVGRFPGAVALPWTATLRDDVGRLKSPAELRALLEGAGVTPDRSVVLLARFGAEAAHTWLVLTLLGYPDVVVYDGGWAAWSTAEGTDRPPLEAVGEGDG